MAEGTSLLRMHTAYTCIVGSNPTVSAKYFQKALDFQGLFVFLHLDFASCPQTCPQINIRWRRWLSEGRVELSPLPLFGRRNNIRQSKHFRRRNIFLMALILL